MVASKDTSDVLNISGHVREGDSSGPGLEGVDIYMAVAVYEGRVVATTDADGYYKIPSLNTQGHQETIRVWAEKGGYVLEPDMHIWVYYGDSSTVTRDFVAMERVLST